MTKLTEGEIRSELGFYGKAYLVRLRKEATKEWNLACQYDGVEPSSFVVFSDDNPHAGRYDEIMAEYGEAMRIYKSTTYIDI